MGAKAKDFKEIYARFNAPIAKQLDCGKFCAPLNGGQPICCTTEHAIPVVDKEEWRLLKSRTDLWHRFKPHDAQSRNIVKDLSSCSMAIECKGAAFCERENRSLACRAFPFYPYFTKDKTLFGLSYYWAFEDRCWVLSNLACVEKEFVDEMIAAYELLFERDKDEEQAFIDNSADMRRVFSRWERDIPIIGRDGEFYKIEPKSNGRIIKMKPAQLERFGPYRSQKAYRQAIIEEGGNPDKAPKLEMINVSPTKKNKPTPK